MLENLIIFVTYLSPLQFVMLLVWIIVLLILFALIFDFLFLRAPLLNPGTLLGCGVAGTLGLLLLAISHGDWNDATVLALFVLGGCIGSGLFVVTGGGGVVKAITG